MDDLQKKINELGDKMQELAPHAIPGKNFSKKKAGQYYELLCAFQEAKKEQRENNNSLAKTKETQSKKTFINSFGEATKREITTTTYERQQKRLDREIMRFIAK